MIRYYINLEQSVERREHIEQLFQDLHLPVQRVDAVDGRKMSKKQLEALRPALGDRHFWLKEMTPGEIGAYLSHLKAWKMFLSTKEEWALIVEDDAFFRENITDFITDSKWIPEEVGLIQLTAGKEAKVEIRAPELIDIPCKRARLLNIWRWGNMGSLGYLVNRRTAKVLIEISKSILGPIDDILFLHASPLRKKVKAWGLSPSIIYFNDDFDSDVGLDKKNNKTPMLSNPLAYFERKSIMLRHKIKCLSGEKDIR